jgi:NADH:ubiquinone oxidoreductase subunit K
MFEIDLIFALALFAVGLFGLVSNKDFLRIFFSLEMLINAVILLLASSAKYLNLPDNLPFAYMLIILATLEAAVGILIFAAANKLTNATSPDELREESNNV